MNTRTRGITIIELLVAMTIFMVVATLAIGAFVSVSRMKALTSTMKESQQKMRITLEMLTRLSRQAEKVTVSGNNVLDLYFNISDPAKITGTRFFIDSANHTIYIYDCSPGSITSKVCTSWSSGSDLLGGNLDLETGSFTKLGSFPPILNITLDGRIRTQNPGSYFYDQININTAVILENIK